LWLVLTNWGETAWPFVWLHPLSCCCTHHSQCNKPLIFRVWCSCDHHHHHHKHQGLGHLAHSVSRVTAALASISLVSQLFSFLVDCSGMILKGFGVVAFFAGARASSFCIHLSCPVCIQSVVHGVWSRLSYGH
jgi:hypothetical protein